MSSVAGNRSARRRVLIAEDDAITSELFSNLLAGFDSVDVVSVSDGREALVQALTQHFDLILTDQNLPELAGDKLLRHLRASRSLNSDTRVMLLSASSLDELQSQGVHIPRDCYISKPVQAGAFLEAVAPFLE